MEEAGWGEPQERSIVNSELRRLAAQTLGRRVAFDPPGDALLLQPTPLEEYLPFFPLFSLQRPELQVIHLTPQWGCCPERRARVDALLREQVPLFAYEVEGQVRWYVFRAE